MYDNCLVLQRSFNHSLITIINAQLIWLVPLHQVTCVGFMNPINIKWSDVVARELFHLSHIIHSLFKSYHQYVYIYNILQLRLNGELVQLSGSISTSSFLIVVKFLDRLVVYQRLLSRLLY